ncbi:hypothetical protein B5C34_00860 [Pacificimonas flava]|uniref:T6SS Phospholipase effector Tle1-like catalytic domain-containing protein n=2 Tax=Pacificimonas TaxID=1960290 RepID=A0A219B2U1_9SPHN|nr:MULTISPECIES: DUF2235 domain-containing protein [Pacificimonas]MBZ6378237.1 DUF2235 domain-containing protein [Pacificimonas aurantium]OWV32139.1 hypothetical protein B5C34_00860 [Pacificimonas flava]
MSKNIVILMDGTSNQISRDRTNVLRMYGILRKSDEQLVYYDPGVGTFARDHPYFARLAKMKEVRDLATGWGLDENVKQAYRFLMHNYSTGPRVDGGHPDRDRIYLIGFSRGAYSARVLAGFINAVGLIEPRNENLLDHAYKAYKRIGEQDDDSFAEVRLYERVLAPDRPPIRMLALFDTVSSVIEHFALRTPYAYTRTNPSVQTVAHAVALHERRRMFQPELWPVGQPYRGNPFAPPLGEQDVREVWFAGGHGDVGGGYAEAESALAKVPLVWMIEQARECGLDFVTSSVNAVVHGTDDRHIAPDPLGAAHDTMTTFWKAGDALVAALGALGAIEPRPGGPRHVPDGAIVHGSVPKRLAELGEPTPNLPQHYDVVA